MILGLKSPLMSTIVTYQNSSAEGFLFFFFPFPFPFFFDLQMYCRKIITGSIKRSWTSWLLRCIEAKPLSFNLFLGKDVLIIAHSFATVKLRKKNVVTCFLICLTFSNCKHALQNVIWDTKERKTEFQNGKSYTFWIFPSSTPLWDLLADFYQIPHLICNPSS